MDKKETPDAVASYRSLTTGWQITSAGLSLIGVLWVINYVFYLRPFGFVPIDSVFLYVLLAIFLPLSFIWFPPSAKAGKTRVPWYDILLSAACLVVCLYFVYHQNEIIMGGWGSGGAPPDAIIFSFILWLLAIEAGRRAAGPVFGAVVLFFSFYPLFAHLMPALLLGPALSFDFLAGFHGTNEESIIGIPMIIFGRLLVGYMVYAIALKKLGAGEFFMGLAMAVVGKTRGGSAKVAIFASGFFGSISGSAMANVMTTGTITIPAMKRDGLPPYFAGAVEAAASSGGTLMPPIMGVTAFIMSEFLGVPYVEVVLAAAVPAALYYICLFAQIDSFAAKIGLEAPMTAEAPPIHRFLFNHFHIILSFVLLILQLFFLRLDSQAPWYATGLAIFLAMLRKKTRLNFRFFLGIFVEAGKVLGGLSGIMAAVGLILGSLVVTGIAHSLPYSLVSLAGGNIYAMLFFGALACFILGMGLTVSAVYVFLAIVLAPGLVSAGLNVMAVHLFVLYCGIWSTITPPVALAAFVAASMSGASSMKTGFQAMQLGVAKYVLPFAFVLSPALILHGTPMEIIRDCFTCLVGLVILSGALEGYFWRIGHLTIISRVLFSAAGMLLTLPISIAGISSHLYGGSAFVIILGLYYFLACRRSALLKLLVMQTSQELNST